MAKKPMMGAFAAMNKGKMGDMPMKGKAPKGMKPAAKGMKTPAYKSGGKVMKGCK